MAVQKQFSGIHVGYIGIHETDEERAFVHGQMQENLVNSYMKGGPMVNGEKVPTEMPQDLLDALPPAPALNRLVVTGEESSLGVPIALVEEPNPFLSFLMSHHRF